MKKFLLLSWLIVIFSGIYWLFWHNDWKYSLPTPLPVNYHAVNRGTYIDLPVAKDDKPVFLHFFNPACPCSKFNIKHFRTLVKQYRDRVSFVVVVVSRDRDYTAKDIQQKFDLDIPVLLDHSIATSCGVYSTPQAAILDAEHKLYYRGNYNKSRYCTNINSNYAKMAMDSLLDNRSNPVFDIAAFKSYGCSLPGCKK